MRIRGFIASVFLLVVATAAQAVDLSGKWVGTHDSITVYCPVPPTSSGTVELEITQAADSFEGTFLWIGLNPEGCVQATEPSSYLFVIDGTIDGSSIEAIVSYPGEGTIGTVSGSVSGNAMSFTFTIPISPGDQGYPGTDTIVTAQATRVPPPVTPSASVNSLWPPNHKMVDIGLIRDASSTFIVYSDEDDAGEPDATGSLLLRAERAGTGDGRVYLIAVTAADGVTTTCLTAVVPKSQSASDIASVDRQAAAALAQCPSPSSYFVIGN